MGEWHQFPHSSQLHGCPLSEVSTSQALFLASQWHAEASGVAFHNGHLISLLVGKQPEMFIPCGPTGLTARVIREDRGGDGGRAR